MLSVKCIPKVGSKVQYGAAGHDQGVGSSFIPAKEPGTWGDPRGEGRTRGVDTPYLGKRGGKSRRARRKGRNIGAQFSLVAIPCCRYQRL